ncbi:MAG TPA: hypothetical protein VNC50_02530, partial [Planctomycetia bacterium]|nr:hypothetical protein [Planctomycetia bacterium]
MHRSSAWVLIFAATLTAAAPGADPPAKTKPRLADFMGLNVHTVQFKPDLYLPVTRLVRDYHDFRWDVGEESDFKTTFPFARNRVDWGGMYGGWAKKGYRIDACVMFDTLPAAKWKNLEADAERYGLEFAKAFGPGGKYPAVESIEIGNEPGKYDDATYRKLFEAAAKGARAGDPKLKIATCAAFAEKSGDYHKSLETVRGLEALYDVVNVHSYPQLEPWPTWRRSFPEDPRLDWLKKIDAAIAWRNEHAKGKEVWLTEFGWDSSTKPAEKNGDFKQWVGVSDMQQAQYLVRGFFALAELDLDRAYIYWFNDDDKPSLHASSGLTRHYRPKPSFHAVAHLFRTLGEHRLQRAVVKKPGEVYAFEFAPTKRRGQTIWAIWSPTGSNRRATVKLPAPAGA